ncbi:transposase [Actinacidiphila polyblastidii]|uniref:transposase n=1 Tax=Actinacidiphila polyblastidii TaxID=3110430 RepID=UPI0039BC8852
MAAGHSMDAARWRTMFDHAMARIARWFRRVEPRDTARGYLLGLLSGVERKNCWQMAEQAAHARPRPMQRLLRSAHWDADEVRDDVRFYVVEHLGTNEGVLIVDETGFLLLRSIPSVDSQESNNRPDRVAWFGLWARRWES